jgi:hypothetical protein
VRLHFFQVKRTRALQDNLCDLTFAFADMGHQAKPECAMVAPRLNIAVTPTRR